MNLSLKRKQYVRGLAIPLLNSENWDPLLHPRNSLGQFVYTDGGDGTYAAALGLSGKLGVTQLEPSGKRLGVTQFGFPSDQISKDRSGLIHDHGTPPNSKTFKTLDGTTFLAPAGADFNVVYYEGEANGLLAFWNAVKYGYHYGVFDFQRNAGNGYKGSGNIFYDAYTPASNYAIGVYLNGAGLSLQNSLRFAGWIAKRISSNAGDPNQALWTKYGWQAANAGKPNGL